MPAPEALLFSAAALGPPRHLSFSDVNHSSACVSWEAPRPVRLVKVSYVSSDGSHSGQVRAGAQKSQGPPGGPRILGRFGIPTGTGGLVFLRSHPSYSSLWTPSVRICLSSFTKPLRWCKGHGIDYVPVYKGAVSGRNWGRPEARTHTYTCSDITYTLHVYADIYSDVTLRLWSHQTERQNGLWG